jgi:hypothetical protein
MMSSTPARWLRGLRPAKMRPWFVAELGPPPPTADMKPATFVSA